MTTVAGQQLCLLRHRGRSTARCRLISPSIFDVVYLALKGNIIARTALCGLDIKELIPFGKESRAYIEIWDLVDLIIVDLSYKSGLRR